jgi:hypothetical protein
MMKIQIKAKNDEGMRGFATLERHLRNPMIRVMMRYQRVNLETIEIMPRKFRYSTARNDPSAQQHGLSQIKMAMMNFGLEPDNYQFEVVIDD